MPNWPYEYLQNRLRPRNVATELDDAQTEHKAWHQRGRAEKAAGGVGAGAAAPSSELHLAEADAEEPPAAVRVLVSADLQWCGR